MDLDFTGSYLSGETLRIYRPGDGYYDVNLTTGQETKALDAQLENAWGWQLTEQYAVESTLLSRPLAHQEEPVDRVQAMTLYDGEQWRPVSLPEELAQGPLLQNPPARGCGLRPDLFPNQAPGPAVPVPGPPR
ncbi:MAG: hypothetical protein ACLU9S_23980 [Oscillospiraceae bacterium]